MIFRRTEKCIYIKGQKYVENKVIERIKNIQLGQEKLRSKKNNKNDPDNIHKFAPKLIDLTDTNFTEGKLLKLKVTTFT